MPNQVPSRGGPARAPASRSRRALRLLWRALLVSLLLSIAAVGVLRWVPPPTSAFMLERSVGAWWRGERDFRLQHQWVDWGHVSPELPIALVAAEDQKFPLHHGFDWDAIEAAWERNQQSRRIHGASTISQQTAKNLFLWSGRSWVRKGLEGYFTVLIEALWPKRRILEVYLNVAEFGDGIYGAEAASRAYFHKPALALDGREAALLAAVLPNPRKLHPERPSSYVLAAAGWIQRQTGQLGGPAYLEAAHAPEHETRVRRR
jgi:monofunctional biosynthetic peptidoglycan transglycosylase